MTDPEGNRCIYCRDNLLKEVGVERGGDPDRVQRLVRKDTIVAKEALQAARGGA